MRNSPRLWIASMMVLALGLPNSSVEAYCRMTTGLPSPVGECNPPDPNTTPPEQYLQWQQRCTEMTLSAARFERDGTPIFSNDLTESEIRTVLASSIQTWESTRCDATPIEVSIGISEATTNCTEPVYQVDGANANTLTFVTDWVEKRNDPQAFALTTVWFSTQSGEIYDVDMEINELRGSYAICPDDVGCENGAVDLENVITHELGHYLGLAHSDIPTTTMFYAAERGEILKRDLDLDDLAGICSIYPSGTLPSTCETAPRGGFAAECQEGCTCGVIGASSQQPSRTTASLFAAFAAMLVFRRQRCR